MSTKYYAMAYSGDSGDVHIVVEDDGNSSAVLTLDEARTFARELDQAIAEAEAKQKEKGADEATP